MPGDVRSAGDVAVPVDIVAIGASAGGVEALRVVIDSLPARLPIAVVVVQHLNPRVPSRLAELLGRHSRLPVKEAADGESIVAGVVYLAQPGRHLLVREGRLGLSDSALVHFSRPSVDSLFESVADAYGDRAVGIILSGTGVDGAAGVRAIKAHGGTTIAQDPATAAYDGMPEAARATGCVDLVLPLTGIGPAVAALVGSRVGGEKE
jgi:two-component system, chemotaxis family, protein-glutamate methylesterase/glutaminase